MNIFRIHQSKLAITASTTSWVVLPPPRSFVRYFPSEITRFTAVSRRSAKEGNWRCRSIMADDRSKATGFAFFCSNNFSFPTFPAEAPCSKTAWSAPTFPVVMLTNSKWEALENGMNQRTITSCNRSSFLHKLRYYPCRNTSIQLRICNHWLNN